MMVGKTRRLANPRKRKANKAKRKLSAKQIKHFGTKRQRAALKSARKRKTNPKRSAARRTTPKVIYRTRTVKAKTKRRTNRRSNPLQMVTLGLVNPHKRRSNVTRTKKRKSTKARKNPRRRNTKVVVLARKNAHRHTRRSNSRRRNPLSIGGASGTKGVLELVGGGVAGVALGNAVPGFLPAVLTSNPLFTAGSIAVVGYFAGMLVGKFASKNIGDGVTFGAWMQAASGLISSFAPGLGLSGFVPASFNEPDNPVWAGNQKLLAARAAAMAASATKPSMNGVRAAYGDAY